ncbi:MAG: META domain-containing protein [Deltaproteobacteria bacterium]|jgi:heat shock protein HslJ|nr:META domain-containing protein [Deltaproteobacteria bacterium]
MSIARIAATCLLLAFLPACAAGPRAADENAGGLSLDDVAGRTFFLVSMDGKSPEGAKAPELAFTREGRVVGAACNRFSGPARIAHGTLTAEQTASTRMACFQPFLNELEQILFGMFQHGARASLADGRLTLTRDGHVLVYAPPPPKP